MSQKYIKSQNNNSHNAKTYGKYYAQPSYDEKFIETDEIADFIQTQVRLRFLLCAIGVQSLAHHLLEESNWHRAPLSNVYFKCGGYFREEKCGVSKKCGAE